MDSQLFYDPCIGGGVTLIALANIMREKGYNYQRSLRALCGDIDGNVLNGLCTVFLVRNRCDI